MDWKYVKPIASVEIINEFERNFNYKFPADYKECAIKYNGGRPKVKVFDTTTTKECEFKSLLSFNRDDRETIWNVNENCKESYIVFAIDSAGNSICFNKSDNTIIFVNHETKSVEKIADNFTTFINSLYSI